MTTHLCPDCTLLYPTSLLTCPECGSELQPIERVEKVMEFSEIACEAAHGPTPQRRRRWEIG